MSPGTNPGPQSALPEFSRMVDRRQIVARPLELSASEAERAGLASRFGLVSIDKLEAHIELAADGDAVDAAGTLSAGFVQSCAVTGDDLPMQIEERIAFRFVPEGAEATPDEEVELDAGELDEISYSGTSFDLGEAVAQSLALAIDPYAVGPGADQTRKEAGLLDEQAAGPFAGLAAFKPKED